jgi:hypothetical protein
LTMVSFLGGRTCPTFRETCEVCRLVDTYASLDKCLEEATTLEVGAIFVISTEGRCIHGLGHSLK